MFAPLCNSRNNVTKTIEVPSFISDSPPTIAANRFGAPTSFSTISTAIGSVVLSAAPNANASYAVKNGGPDGIKKSGYTATSAAPPMTPGKISHMTCQNDLLNVRILSLITSENSSGGR